MKVLSTIPTAIVGAGHLGSYHAQALHRLDPRQPRWIVDTAPGRAAQLAAEVGARSARELDAVLPDVSAVILATPTESHFEIGCRALRAGCHLFVEKPMTQTVEQGQELVALAAEVGRKLQVGHVERFNPILRAARDDIGVPAFVEAERLAPFVPRSVDVDVVLDLMIHDLDILLSLVPYAMTSLDAVGVAVLTARADIANARLRFENGTVANLTASRVSREKLRKIRFFGASGYLSLDLLAHRGRRAVIRPDAGGNVDVPGVGRFQVTDEEIEAAPGDAITEEIRAFLTAIHVGAPPAVSGKEALRVLEIASQIQRAVRGSLERYRGAARPAARVASEETQRTSEG